MVSGRCMTWSSKGVSLEENCRTQFQEILANNSPEGLPDILRKKRWVSSDRSRSLKHHVEIDFPVEAEEAFPQDPHLYLLPFFPGKEFYFHVVYGPYWGLIH